MKNPPLLLQAVLDPPVSMLDLGFGQWVWHLDENHEQWTSDLFEMLGWDPAVLANGPVGWRNRCHVNDLQAHDQAWSTHAHDPSDRPFIVTLRLTHEDGSARVIERRGRVVRRSELGEPLVAAGTHLDRTEQFALQERLEKSEALIARTHQLARVGGWEVDLLNDKVYWTDVTRELHGMPPDYVPCFADALAFFKEGESREKLRAAFAACITDGTPYDLELELVAADGTSRWIRGLGEAEFVDGRCVRAFGSCQDIHEMKLHREAALAGKDAADEANAAKSAFVAAMSHEIRTPLNGVIGSTDLLSMTEVTEEQDDLIKMILQSGDALLSTINDVLDYSKIEANQIELERRPFSPVFCAEQVLDMVIPQAREKRLELGLLPTADVPLAVLGDETRVRQVLTNLIGNAVKFTAEGFVEVEISQPQPDQLRFAVRDSGIGIAPDRQKRLFEPFFQADNSTTRRFGGTGLGLTIARRLVDAMGGELSFTSAKGAGTTFCFTLPLAAYEGPDLPEEWNLSPDVNFQGKCALVVDDRPTNRRVAQLAFESAGGRCVLTDCWAAAARELAERPRFDVILLDRFLPDADGELVMRELHTRFASKLPPVVLLACDLAGVDRQRFSSVLLKPLKVRVLLETVEHVTRRKKQRWERGFAATANAMQDTEIDLLAVEDNPMGREVMRRLLNSLGLTHAKIVPDGDAAVAEFRDGDYSIVLMDCAMPILDGYQTTKAIREMEHAEGRPPSVVIGVSAAASLDDRARAIKAGMDQYITKPLRLGPLRDALESSIRVLKAPKKPSNVGYDI